MVVYRVEMPDGLGPYWSQEAESFRHKMAAKHSDPDAYPDAYRDFSQFGYSSRYIFGFKSMKKLFAWFGGFIPIILKNGGKIVKYIVDDKHVLIGHSGKQLVFDKDYAQLVNA